MRPPVLFCQDCEWSQEVKGSLNAAWDRHLDVCDGPLPTPFPASPVRL